MEKYPKRSNKGPVNYTFFDYDSCTEGMSTGEEDEIDNVFINDLLSNTFDVVESISDVDDEDRDDSPLINFSTDGPMNKCKKTHGRGKEKQRRLPVQLPNMTEKSYDTADAPNILPAFSPTRKPGFHLDSPLLRGKFVNAVEFFQLFFTDEMIEEICSHTNEYAWAYITNKQSYAEKDGSWKEIKPDEFKYF